MSLDCYYCGKEFFDFAPLAHHVQVVHSKRPWHKNASSWFEKEKQDMNVGAYTQGTGDRLPLLDAKLFKKVAKNGKVVAKVLAVREQMKPSKKGWTGLILDLKSGENKFSFLCSFDRYDIGAIVRQVGSEETDDWIGQNVKFVAKKGTKGGIFVNVENPKRKG